MKAIGHERYMFGLERTARATLQVHKCSCGASASVVQTAVRFFREGAEPLGHEQIPVAMGHPSWGSQMGFM